MNLRFCRGAFVLVVTVGCTEIQGGNRQPMRDACEDLCLVWAASEGCRIPDGPCVDGCAVDSRGFTERCMLAARRYYECSLEVAWSCPGAPDAPETGDARCAAEEKDWLSCKVTGAPRPEASSGP